MSFMAYSILACAWASAAMREFWLRFGSHRYGAAAGVYVLVLILVMLVLEVIPGSDPHDITSAVMQPPSADTHVGYR